MSLLLLPLVHTPLPLPLLSCLLLLLIPMLNVFICVHVSVYVCSLCCSLYRHGNFSHQAKPLPSTPLPLASSLMLVVANLLLLFALNFMLMFMFFSNKSREPIEIETLLAVRISPELLRPYTVFIFISISVPHASCLVLVSASLPCILMASLGQQLLQLLPVP